MIVGRGRFVICAMMVVAVGLVMLSPADAALFGLWKSAKKEVTAPTQSIIVFPFDQGDVSRVPTTFGEYVASDLRNLFSAADRYNAYLFRERLAPIARAKQDNTLRPADTIPPFTEDRTKAWKLAQLLAADYFVVGSIDDYQVDSAKKVAMITLSAELVDAKTGRLIKTVLVTGRTPENAASGEEEELRDAAKGDAVTRLSVEIMAPKKPVEPLTEGAAPAAEDSAQPQAGNNAEGNTAEPKVAQ